MSQAKKERKKFQSRNPFLPDPGQKIRKRKSKKIQKIKKYHSGTISIQTVMRQAEKERNKFKYRIPILPDPGQKIPKKIVKIFKNIIPTLFESQPLMRQAEKEKKKNFVLNSVPIWPGIENFQKKNIILALFLSKLDKIGREREKKNLAPNSVRSRPGQENSKKNSKTILKIKKPHSGIISIQIRMRQAQKERKKFQYQISFLPDPGQKSPKKIAKKFKKTKKHHPGIISIQT